MCGVISVGVSGWDEKGWGKKGAMLRCQDNEPAFLYFFVMQLRFQVLRFRPWPALST